MDMFTGADRSIPNSEVFPQHITPFPEAADFFFSNPTSVIRSADAEFIDRRPALAAQKLRPIRCNGGRSPATEAPVTGGVAGTLECCDDVVSPEMGFLGRQDLCGFSFDTQAKGGYGGLAENGGGGGNGSGTGLDSLNPNQFDEESSSSSSSEDDNDSLADDNRGPLNRKRKRKSKSTTQVMMLFLENLTMKVMERQEQMHRQLMEMLEMRERERINREEAWKQQEMERMKRDEQQRAQEKSRSLSLISLIQNLLGHEVEIPKSLATLPMEEEDAGEVHIQTDIKCELNNRRWPEAEVRALITVRSGLEQKFRMMSPKGSVWEEISFEMHKMGYNRSAKKCKEKWENINKYFKRSMESGKKRPENIKTCSYFHELDILYKSGLVSSGNSSHNTEHENAASSENPSLNN